jgi:transcriptional regulator with GAF, ATPase, and Fis domain
VIVKRVERWLEIEIVLQSPKVKKNIIGCSDKWLATLREVVEVARFSNLSVLITGESGTGKELISRLIHQLDTRIDKSDLILTDCSSISSELSGSEFFGHEKGAYTNAIASRDGAFALANKGTLFLDEIGELPLSLQAELLRVIQEGTYKRVGSNIWKQTDFRLVSATNKNLVDEVHLHRFRQDLYFRLSGWVIELPPLRERIADIPQLVEHFLTEAFNGEKYVEVDDKLMSFLTSRSYPGNIRELKQLVNRLVLKYPGTGPLTIGLLPKEELKSVKSEVENKEYNSLLHQGIHKSILTGIGVKEIKDMVGNIAIKIALGQENGNIQRAALKLGLTDRSIQLWKKMNGDLQSLDDTFTEN